MHVTYATITLGCYKIGEYVDTVECDVAPMSVCQLLLGRPRQYDRYSQHCGRTNQFTIDLKGNQAYDTPTNHG